MTRKTTTKQTRVAMVVFSHHPHDLRVRRAVEAAVEASYEVDLFCLRKRGQPKLEKSQGLTIYRYDVPRSRSSIINYLVEYGVFLALVFVRLSARHIKARYSVIHVNNMPDILVFAGLLAKISGARILLDLHDPVPEVYLAKYGVARKEQLVRLMKMLERLCIAFSDKVITPNIAFRDLFIERGCPGEKIDIVMNAPDQRIFVPGPPFPADGEGAGKPFRVVFNGIIAERNGLDTAIDAVLMLSGKIPGITFDIYGEGDAAARTAARVRSLGEGSCIRFRGFVPIAELVKYIARSDVGVIPNNRNPFTEINFPVRIFEYLTFRKPVIAPNTRGIRDYFAPDGLLMFEPGDPGDLARKIDFVYSQPKETAEIVRKGYAVYEKHNWTIQKEKLLRIYEELSR